MQLRLSNLLSVALLFAASGLLNAQSTSSPSSSVVEIPKSPATTAPVSAADYPTNQAGVLIHSSGWTALNSQMPARIKNHNGIAAGLSYGLVPAKVISVYAGLHAPTQVEFVQPTICICHIISLPGDPILVRLHSKKNTRELDGGKMIVYPIVGGSRMADAAKSDWIPADISHPDPQVWLVRPLSPLPPGEYALMLGSQNVSIFPFTVLSPSASPGTTN